MKNHMRFHGDRIFAKDLLIGAKEVTIDSEVNDFFGCSKIFISGAKNSFLISANSCAELQTLPLPAIELKPYPQGLYKL
jgi:hypothetical protein